MIASEILSAIDYNKAPRLESDPVVRAMIPSSISRLAPNSRMHPAATKESRNIKVAPRQVIKNPATVAWLAVTPMGTNIFVTSKLNTFDRCSFIVARIFISNH